MQDRPTETPIPIIGLLHPSPMGAAGAHNCGVDMIARTWNTATGGMAPGVTSCSVRLSTARPMGGTAARCAIRPDSIAGKIFLQSVPLPFISVYQSHP